MNQPIFFFNRMAQFILIYGPPISLSLKMREWNRSITRKFVLLVIWTIGFLTVQKMGELAGLEP